MLYQRLIADTVVEVLDKGQVTLPRGSLVKVVGKKYLPKGHSFILVDDEQALAVYTQVGIVLVDPKMLEWIS